MRPVLGVLLLSLLCLPLVGTACHGQPESRVRPTLTIAIQPTATPEVLTAESEELKAFLQQRLPGVEIALYVPTMYVGAIEALRFGHAQAAFMSAWPAALAKIHAGAEIALAEVREVVIEKEKVERPFYFSYWVVPKHSPFQSLTDLRGKRVAFPSPLSTSGYVFPLARLVELGLIDVAGKEADPRQFFGEVLFAGGYAQAWEALKQGQVDVTVIAGDVPEQLYHAVRDATRVVEQQGPIPSHAVVFSKDLQEPLRSQFTAALLELGQAKNRPMMRKFISSLFVGFQEARTEEHLGTLFAALQRTNVSYTERLK
ncbi:MAG: phosphate/phosphite/phosphonate ABC transporter substrate-binding protein [Candidatus Binatia bacterium]|nr:phosphate/phosphite/phosphonate ABC transporter substrate-binding protein [Candidatus Binatia bacterium]